jgi:hypothetical protein
LPCCGEREQEAHQPAGDGDEREHVEPPDRGRPELRQEDHRGDDAEDADRHVDEEDQPPVDVLHEVAAQGRADGRSDDDARPYMPIAAPIFAGGTIR